MKTGRPRGTGSTLVNPFEGVHEELPLPKDAPSRGYLAMRRSPSGPLTTTQLRQLFGEPSMEVSEGHLRTLDERGVLTYARVRRGHYSSWLVELLDNVAAADYLAELTDACGASDAKQLLDYFWKKSDSAIYWHRRQPQQTGRDYLRAASVLGQLGCIERAKLGVRLYFEMTDLEEHRRFGEFGHYYKQREAILSFIEQKERDDRHWRAQAARESEERRECWYEGPVLSAKEALLAAIALEASHGADDDDRPDLLRVEFERILIDRCQRAGFDLQWLIEDQLQRLALAWGIAVPEIDAETRRAWGLEVVAKELKRLKEKRIRDAEPAAYMQRADSPFRRSLEQRDARRDLMARPSRDEERRYLQYRRAVRRATAADDLLPFFEEALDARDYTLAAMLHEHISEGHPLTAAASLYPDAYKWEDDDEDEDEDDALVSTPFSERLRASRERVASPRRWSRNRVGWDSQLEHTSV